jgi:hypothetical protein
MKVFVGSWNVGNKRPEGLANFLPSADADYDIIAIGLQESTYAHVEEDHSQNAAHVAANIVLDACIHHFKQELSNVLGSDYYIVQHVRRAQLQLYIFAKAELQKSISDVNWSAENTGFLHVFPNKVRRRSFFSSYRIFSCDLWLPLAYILTRHPLTLSG